MQEKVQSIVCPRCGEKNNRLLVACKNCQVTLTQLNIMLQRIQQLERAGAQYIQQNAFVSALRTYSILLEYKPEQIKYLKNLCYACIGLNALKDADGIVATLESRLKIDPEIAQMKKLIAQKTDGNRPLS